MMKCTKKIITALVSLAAITFTMLIIYSLKESCNNSVIHNECRFTTNPYNSKIDQYDDIEFDLFCQVCDLTNKKYDHTVKTNWTLLDELTLLRKRKELEKISEISKRSNLRGQSAHGNILQMKLPVEVIETQAK